MAEYEQKRLQNIADRKNKIDELKITDISLELASEINQQQQNKCKSSYSKRGLSAVPKEKEILPPRKSRRLQNIDADTGYGILYSNIKKCVFFLKEHPRNNSSYLYSVT